MSDGCKQRAMAAIALGLFLQLCGCLNPRPEELPSGTSSPNAPGSVERETCETNPLLTGCELPDSDITGEPIGDNLGEDADEAGSANPEPAPENLSGGGGGGRDGGAAAGAETDAGSLGDASDAGAP